MNTILLIDVGIKFKLKDWFIILVVFFGSCQSPEARFKSLFIKTSRDQEASIAKYEKITDGNYSKLHSNEVVSEADVIAIDSLRQHVNEMNKYVDSLKQVLIELNSSTDPLTAISNTTELFRNRYIKERLFSVLSGVVVAIKALPSGLIKPLPDHVNKSFDEMSADLFWMPNRFYPAEPMGMILLLAGWQLSLNEAVSLVSK